MFNYMLKCFPKWDGFNHEHKAISESGILGSTLKESSKKNPQTILWGDHCYIGDSQK